MSTVRDAIIAVLTEFGSLPFADMAEKVQGRTNGSILRAHVNSEFNKMKQAGELTQDPRTAHWSLSDEVEAEIETPNVRMPDPPPPKPPAKKKAGRPRKPRGNDTQPASSLWEIALHHECARALREGKECIDFTDVDKLVLEWAKAPIEELRAIL